MAEALHVELVSADRTVWSGDASQVSAHTVEGDIGVLRGHTPLLSLLSPSLVEITPATGAKVFASVDGGFISVANDRVSILAEHITLGQEINAAQARADLESAQASAGVNAEFDAGVRLAQARLDAALKAS
ncbi:F0F1 ATP synthase subunit epsilon [Nocardioides sp. Iso805N]|uniref:F0F1 ATP synthase subunit epsilon n=1 Tax=Nocardioides sp. Iso805N TaxID=1283287 RepID=UPI00036F811A|nr:F0F1 ATP synthase subunit epsilon [Nocardioides sp. Iso805N]